MAPADPKALILCTVFPVLSVLAVIARFWARSLQKAKLAADDWMILPALAFTIGNAINVLYGAFNANLGHHMPLDKHGFALMGPKLVALDKMVYVSEIVVTVATTCARLSILFFYARIFTTRSFKILVYVVSAINFTWGIAFTFAYMFQCTPIQGFWTQSQGKRVGCIDISVNYYHAVSTILIDVLVLALPWPMVWRLKMEMRQKVAIICIFMLGGIVTGVSIGKCYTFFTIGELLRKYHDQTFSEAPLLYWTVPECCLSVVCACLPTLRPIFRGMSPESLIGSIRSVLSLSSLRNGSKGSNISQSQVRRWDDSVGHNDTIILRKKSSDPGSVDGSVAGLELVELEKGNGAIVVTKGFQTDFEHRK